MDERLPAGSRRTLVLSGASVAVCCLLALGALAQEPQQFAEPLVVDVRIVGHQGVKVAKLPRLGTRAGQPLDERLLQEDVRTLFGTRKFIDVKPKLQDVPGGKVVIFEVVERPTLVSVRYVGNKKFKAKKLAKITELEPGEPFDPYAIEEGRRKIEEHYRDRGFPHVHVELAEGGNPADRSAVFVINEGQEKKVLWTQFEGNTIASDARLRTQIQSKPGILWVFKGFVDRKKIDEDIGRLTAYYRSLGFFRARVGRELEFGDSGKWLSLTFVIDEGPRYVVRNVSFVGNTRFSTESLSQDLKLQPTQYFDQMSMNKDLGGIRDIYGSRGYIFADIKADPRFLEEPGQLDLVYDIREGARYRVGRINVNITGENAHTHARTVLNRMTLRPGDIVDTRKIRDIERRLKASGLFLNDPSQGASPKIVFSPPPGVLEQELAEKDEQPPEGNFRGQSPDGATGDITLVQPAYPGEPARVRDVTFSVEPDLTDSPAQVPQQLAPAAAAPQPIVFRGQSPDPGRDTYFSPLERGHSYGAIPRAVGPDAQQAVYHQPLSSPAVAESRFVSYAPAPGAPADAGGWQVSPGLLPPSAASGRVNYQNAPIVQGPDPVLFPYGPPGDASDPYILEPSVPLDAVVSENQTGRFMLGVGINSDAGLVGNVVLQEDNFDISRPPTSFEDIRTGRAWRGAGQKFRMEAAPGTQVQRYVISFTEPYFLDTPVSFSVGGSFYTRRFRDWDEERVTLRTGLGYEIRPNLTVTGSFRAEDIEISDPSVAIPELTEVVGNNDLYGFKVALAHDTRDSPFLPTEGHHVELAVEEVVGSFEYTRETLEARQYFLMHQRPDGSGRHTLAIGGQVGFTGSETPIYDHFYAGGYSTLRGFDFRGASPKNGDVIVGGEFQLLGTVEYMFPITADDMLRAVVFCDFGTVEENHTINSEDFRAAPGFGLRITLPALGPAPIALDFAFPILSEATDDEQVFSFFVGALR